MLLDWLKKDFAKDVATVNAIGVGLTRADSPSRSGVLPLAALGTVIGVIGELLSSGGEGDVRPAELDYIGNQWGTHGHSGPFGQWTED